MEPYPKSLKQNASLEKSPTQTVATLTNLFFAALCAFIKLEMLKGTTKPNHFALKRILYVRTHFKWRFQLYENCSPLNLLRRVSEYLNFQLPIVIGHVLLVACAPAATLVPLPTIAPTNIFAPTSTLTAVPIPSSTPTITATPKPTVAPTLAQSLRGAGFNRKILIGAAVQSSYIRNEPQYAQTLSREFSALTAEFEMKWRTLRPTRTRFSFEGADYLVNFAEANGMQVRGHTLVWHVNLPQWLTDGKFSRDEVIEILRDHIMTVAGRYRGRIYAWDVVNEAIAEDGTGLRDTLWSRTIGPDYIDIAFRFAHEADPNAKLIYNDYLGEGLGKKSDAIYALLKGMKERGVPIDGVGLQSHFRSDAPSTGVYALPKAADVDANMKRLSALGLQAQITELDFRITAPPTEGSLQRQATQYHEYLQTCLANSNCTTFVMWGFTDKYSWIPSSFPGFGAALIFDEQYRPKMAHNAMMDVLNGK